ncbi:hypothetical protein chiPu_0007574 [Chiloscyllium punctatum]|uniref:DNA-directed RNA polymerase subunit n=1 Tax=Chiloscyllium punctatum TaxID=137246 RepID=A0A401SFF1_CHIPU|nr:hypothetical protein [Chiloscyllium punctatum]
MANGGGQEDGAAPRGGGGQGQQLSFSQACALIQSPYSCLVLDTCRRHITLAPVYLKRQRSGIEKQLRMELLRFSESLQGVPIAFDKVRLIGELGDIYDDQGYIHLNIEADFVIFRPKIGQKLMGIVNKVAPSHLGCLVHGCFNASIPKPHKANGTWPGFAVTVGDSLKFEVLQLDADVAGVLCIRGQLHLRLQATCVDSEGSLQDNTGEQNDGIVRKKKKKKKKDETCDREVEETLNYEISEENCHEDQMGSTEVILDSKKHKKKKQKTAELDADTETHGRDDSDYFSDKAVKKKKKKRKLSVDDSELSGYAQKAKCKKKNVEKYN